MRYFPESGGFEEVEIVGPHLRRAFTLDHHGRAPPVDPAHRPHAYGRRRLGFRDRAEAERFLRTVSADFAGMAALRALAAHGASADPRERMTDAEIVTELAARLVAGTLAVEARPHPRIAPPDVAGDEPEQKEEAREEKADQDVEFEITDPFDEPYSDLEWVLVFPDGKTKKTGKLGKDGTVKESSVPPGGYQLLFKLVSAARWGEGRVEVGKEVKLYATAGGFDPGASGKFEIFGDRATDKKPIAKVDGKVNAARVLEGAWTPTDDAVKDVTTGALVFRAKMGSSTSLSSPAPLVRKHTFELEDDEGPLADTDVIVKFSDGHEEGAKSKDGKLDVFVPVGQSLVWLHLPDHIGAHLKIEPEGEDEKEYLLHHDGEFGGGGDGGADGLEEEEEEEEDEGDGEEGDEDDSDEDEDGDEGGEEGDG